MIVFIVLRLSSILFSSTISIEDTFTGLPSSLSITSVPMVMF